MISEPLKLAQLLLLVLTFVTFFAGGLALRNEPTIAAISVPPIPAADAKATGDDIRARSAYYTEVTAAQRQAATHWRVFLIEKVYLPALDSLLKALVAVIALRAAPVAIAALRGDPAAINAAKLP